MAVNLRNVEQRTIQYYFEDGAFEMAIGGIFLLLGLLSLGYGLLLMKSSWGALWITGSIAVAYLGSYLALRYVSHIKVKYTYPRLGYVSYRKSGRDKKTHGFRWGGVLGAFIGATAVTAFRNSVEFSWSMAGGGFVCALILVYVAMRTKTTHLFILSGLVFAGGIVLGQFSLGYLYELSIFGCYMGMLFCISGAITFRFFIKSNPIAEADPS